jgi:hypothetical protein
VVGWLLEEAPPHAATQIVKARRRCMSRGYHGARRTPPCGSRGQADGCVRIAGRLSRPLAGAERIELQRIDPPVDVMSAMHEQMKAERTRRATVTTAEGQRQGDITRAEGERQATIQGRRPRCR